jgi:hypothetical protein
VDVVAVVGADEQASTVVEPGEGAFDDPAVAAESGAVLGLAAGDDRLDAALPDVAAVVVVVVAAVGDQRPRPASWTADAAADGRHSVEQSEQLGDVVAVAAGERPGERDAAAVYEQVVLAAPAAAIDGAGTCFRAPFFACRWLESAIARSHSS